MPNVRIKPFRDYSEHDVLNLFAFDQASGDRGTVVKLNTAWTNEDNTVFAPVVPGNSYPNTVSNRYAVTARVTTAGTGDVPVGIMLYDTREYDENGEPLLFRPQKLIEMQAVLSGNIVPILRRGMILISGTQGTPGIGSGIYVGANGIVTTTGNANATLIGRFLGSGDTHGYALASINCYV
jgi:hypothetical protein